MKPQFSDLIENLVVTTDRFMTGSCTPSDPSGRSSAHGAKSRIAAVPLVWSAALRVNRDIFIQASIEYVVIFPNSGLIYVLDLQSRPSARVSPPCRIEQVLTAMVSLGYWRGLWSRLDFADRPLKECLNVIHADIVEIWNLNDTTRVGSLQYLCWFLVVYRDSVSFRLRFQSEDVSCR